MGTGHTAAPEPCVIQEGDRPVEGWNDDRGRLTWRPSFSADSTPTDRLVTGSTVLRFFYALAADDFTDVEYVFS